MPLHRLLAGSVLALLATCLGQDRGGVDVRTGLPILQIAAEKTNAFGSFEYNGRCDGSSDFPKVHAPQNSETSPLSRFRDIFSDDLLMRVTQDSSGRIRMVETDVPRDLLDIRIAHISFNTDAPPHRLNSPGIALHMILATPEVRDFMREHKIGPLEEDTFPLPSDAGSDQPRVSGNLDNVTVSQALDYVVLTYHMRQRPTGHWAYGFWTYKNCPDRDGSRRVLFGFF